MGSDFNKPVITTIYEDVLTFIRDNIINVATWFHDKSGANIPENAKTFSETNKRFEKYESSSNTWKELLKKADSEEAYDIRVAVANAADSATKADSATSAETATSAESATNAGNAGSLGGKEAAKFYNEDNTASKPIPVKNGGTGAKTIEVARSNFGVYSKTEADNAFLKKDDNLSSLTNKGTARGNLEVHSKAEVYSKTEADDRYLNESSNLSDLPDKATARGNLDVHSKAEADNRYGRIPSGAKMYFYQNTAPVGWSIVSGVSDRVLGVKGGDYYSAGGATFGSWDQGDHFHSISNLSHTHSFSNEHRHQWFMMRDSGNYMGYTFDQAGNLTGVAGLTAPDQFHLTFLTSTAQNQRAFLDDGYTNAASISGKTGNSDGCSSETGQSKAATSWRPAAAVGIIAIKN